MKIALLEGFYGGSHKSWADGLVEHSVHEIDLYTLPDRFWKWRMHGGAITLADRFNRSDQSYDLVLASDMIDLGLFASLSRQRLRDTPLIAYFHENQLTYPWSKQDRDIEKKRDQHYGFINYSTALSADKVCFNSEFHRSSFLRALDTFLTMYPDHRNSDSKDVIKSKSCVLPIGIEFGGNYQSARPAGGPPVVLWNHRWEYDKDPGLFFDVLKQLQAEQVDFRLIILGERPQMYPEIFDEARDRFAAELFHIGYAYSRTAYFELLAMADVLPVSSRQDFFGISAVEAMHAGVYPLVPSDLALVEHIPMPHRANHVYRSPAEFAQKLRDLLVNGIPKVPARAWVLRYDWQAVAPSYDALFEEVVGKP